jgi:hypothetical protein
VGLLKKQIDQCHGITSIESEIRGQHLNSAQANRSSYQNIADENERPMA